MWNEGVNYLADEMGLQWLSEGMEMNVTTYKIKVDPAGALEKPVTLVDPEIVVVMSNPAGGIGIGIPTTQKKAAGVAIYVPPGAVQSQPRVPPAD